MRRQVSWIWAGESSETQSHPSWRHSPLLKPKKSEIAIPGFSHPSLSKICQARDPSTMGLPTKGFHSCAEVPYFQTELSLGLSSFLSPPPDTQ